MWYIDTLKKYIDTHSKMELNTPKQNFSGFDHQFFKVGIFFKTKTHQKGIITHQKKKTWGKRQLKINIISVKICVKFHF
jgi:hypothetical protein